MRTKAEIDNNEWFGEVPDSWRMVPLPRLFMSSKGMTVTRADLVDEGAPVVNYAQVHSKLNNRFGIHEELIKHVPIGMVPKGLKYSEKGSFIFACTSEDLAGCGDCIYNDSEQPVNPGGDTLLLSPVDEVENKYLAYLFSTDMWRWQIRRDLVDVKVFHVNQGNLHETYVTVPPCDVQRRIVSYLDERCAAIDDDVKKRQKVIERLKEYKRSLIAHSVTKGLDPSAEMRDSGVEWIGEVPADWELVPIKADVSIGHGSNPTLPGDIPVWGSGSEPFKTCGEFKEGPAVLLGRKGTLDCPQLVVERYWNVDTAFDAKVTTTKLLLKFFYYVATCVDIKPYTTNTAKPSMTQFDWGNSKIPRPFLFEQKKIVKFLDERCASIDEAVSRQEQLIEKLSEYRKSLIHHAVTGKIDCTEATK